MKKIICMLLAVLFFMLPGCSRSGKPLHIAPDPSASQTNAGASPSSPEPADAPAEEEEPEPDPDPDGVYLPVFSVEGGFYEKTQQLMPLRRLKKRLKK